MTNPMDAGNGMADEVVTAVPAGSKLRFAALQGAPARIVQCAELQLQTKLSAWEADGDTLNQAWFDEKKHPGTPPGLLNKLLKREYPHKNVGLKVFNTEPNPVATGAFERLESNQAEIDDLFDSDLLDSSLDISDCLKPSETIVATLQCKGFDGFPDFGESNNQKRTGLCSISLVSRPDAGHGRESEQHLRIIFDHTGTFRSMDAVEELCDCKVLCATTEKYDWTVNREQVTSLAVIDCETQLMGISSHTVDKMNLKKTHGFERPWWWCLLAMCCVPWVLFFLWVITLPEETTDASGTTTTQESSVSPEGLGKVFGVFVVVIAVILGIAILILKFCQGTSSKIVIQTKSADGDLEGSVDKEENYLDEVSALGKKTRNNWKASLSKTNYHAIAICCADPYNNEAREVIAVIDPVVTRKEIAQFILVAHEAKMDRMSKNAAQFDFTANRSMHTKFSRNGGSFGLPDGFGDLIDPTKLVGNLKGVGKLPKKVLCPIICVCICLCFLLFIYISDDEPDADTTDTNGAATTEQPQLWGR